MEAYLDVILGQDLPAEFDGVASTPAADHLFKTRDNVSKLSEKQAELFNRVTAQILFVSQRGRPDLRTAVSFLTKRVQNPDEDMISRSWGEQSNTFDARNFSGCKSRPLT